MIVLMLLTVAKKNLFFPDFRHGFPNKVGMKYLYFIISFALPYRDTLSIDDIMVEEEEAGLETLQEQSMNMSKLPRDVFPSRSIYELYTRRYEWVITTLIYLSVRVDFGELFISSLIFLRDIAFFTIAELLVTYSGQSPLKYKMMSLQSRKELLLEVSTHGPQLGAEKWDQIAAITNEVISHEGFPNSRYYFYDGNCCLDAFRALFVVPYSEQDLSENVPDLDYDIELKSLVRNALIVYRNGLFDHWKEPIVIDSKNLYPNRSLPRDTFQNKFTHLIFVNRQLTYLGVVLVTVLAILHLLALLRVNEFSETFSLTWALDMGLLFYLGLWRTFANARKNSVMTLENRMRFLKEIAKCRPNSNPDGWDIVASNMNAHLSTQDHFSCPYYFYDGSCCSDFFRKLFFCTEPTNMFLRLTSKFHRDKFVELKPYVNEVVSILEEDLVTGKDII